MSSYYFNTLFIETNSSWLIYESINALEINTSTVFNWAFAYNIIWLCFFFFFLVIDFYLLIITVVAKNFIPHAELALLA